MFIKDLILFHYMAKFSKKENTLLVLGVCLVLFVLMFGISALSNNNWIFSIIAFISGITGTLILVNIISEDNE